MVARVHRPMTEFQSRSVMGILNLYGPIKADRISTLMVWPREKTYRVLVKLEAIGKARVASHRNFRAWEAA